MDTLPHPSAVAAIIPCYRDSGDCTAILTTDGSETTIARSVHFVLRRLARQLAADLSALRANACTITQRSILQILPLSSRLVLIPVKMRKPRLRGDPTIGYINFYALESVGPGRRESKACLKLTDGREIPAMWTAATINKYLQSARLVVSQYHQPPPPGSIRESNGMYTPETTGFIIRLIDVCLERMLQKLLKI